MNKAQIKKELRRSACKDRDPAFDVNDWGFYCAIYFRNDKEGQVSKLKFDDCRTYFLLVAEAL